MFDFRHVLAGAALCAGLGATAAFADASALDKFAGAKEAIMSYYGANAREAGCGAGSMTDIGDEGLRGALARLGASVKRT